MINLICYFFAIMYAQEICKFGNQAIMYGTVLAVY